jgi:peptide/nickel transport system substrate-binding protein
MVAVAAAPVAAHSGPPATHEVSGTLHVLSDLGVVNLDPPEANTFATRSLLSGLVIRSLTQLVYDPTRHLMVLKPDLATTLGWHNQDYTQWVFTLRKGLTFGNGRPVTPVDVKFGIERSFDRRTFPGGPRFSNRFFLHGDTYHGPYRSGRAYDGVHISGQRLTLTMARPFPDLPYYLAFPAMSPIPPGKASAPARYRYRPWATGPYVVHFYAPGRSLELTRNPNWDPATDPERAQAFDEVDVRLDMPRAQIDQVLLQDTGYGKSSISLTSVLPADYHVWADQAPDRLVKGLNRCVDMVDPDNRTITNIAVRRALGWAYPYHDAWVAGGTIAGVERIPATNLAPPGTIGRTFYNPLPGHTPGSTNAAKAREILTEAHRLHAVVRFAYKVDDPVSIAVKNVLVVAFKQAGFDPQPYATTTANYVHDILKNPDSSVNLRSVTRCSPFPTGRSVLVPEFHSTDVDGRGFGYNYSAFSNATIDKDMAKATVTPLAQQAAAWNALDRAIQLKHYPTVVTAYHAVALMRGSDVGGALVDNMTGMPTWNRLTLAGS